VQPVEPQPPPAAASLQGVALSGPVYEDSAHRLGRGGEEVAAAVPPGRVSRADQP
jgi:hypothetical protein